MIRIRDASIHWAHCRTLRFIEMTLALHTLSMIDDIDRISRSNCLNWTLRLTESARRAFFVNFICHNTSSFSL